MFWKNKAAYAATSMTVLISVLLAAPASLALDPASAEAHCTATTADARAHGNNPSVNAEMGGTQTDSGSRAPDEFTAEAWAEGDGGGKASADADDAPMPASCDLTAAAEALALLACLLDGGQTDAVCDVEV